MGGSTGCFRSRLPKLLTEKEMNLLSLKSSLTRKDIEEWYLNFNHCYPNGYLSENEFIIYYQNYSDEHHFQLKPLIKQLFEIFDLNNDKKLDFYEFVLFNVLTSDGSIYEKIKLISKFFQNEKKKEFSRDEIKEFLRNIFHIFDIPSSKSNLIDVIHWIFEKYSIQSNEKIHWNLFIDEILNDQSLLEHLISFQIIQQRSERF